MNYKYTKEWFNKSELKRKIKDFMNSNKINNILEIGCYEGLSSVFFSDNFLDISGSSLTCVDPFLHIKNNDHSLFLNNNEEKNFDYNISITKNKDKIKIYKITSDDFFKKNKKKYNFIYIDGCHIPSFIKKDMVNSFNVLKKNGIMWMDDYMGGDKKKIKKVMDNFCISYKDKIKVIHKGYQLAILKLQ